MEIFLLCEKTMTTMTSQSILIRTYLNGERAREMMQIHVVFVVFVWSWLMSSLLIWNNVNAFSAVPPLTAPPIIEAAMTGNTRLVQRLLEQQQQKLQQQRQQQQKGKEHEGEHILLLQTFVNVCDDFNCTPLIWASTTGDHVEIVQLLLQNGANINHQEQLGQTALWRACLCDNYHVAMILLQNGADPTIADMNGVVPSRVADGMCATHIDWNSFIIKQEPPQQQSQQQEPPQQQPQVVVVPPINNDDNSKVIIMIRQELLHMKNEMQQQETVIMELYKDQCSIRKQLESLLLLLDNEDKDTTML